jgi:predicted CXXCH cytochrome family protein
MHWQDFKPGTGTELVFGTYMRSADPSQGIKAVSQAEQMALSRCARESAGRLWCGTCHDPHGQPAANRATQVRQACLSCHATLFDSHAHAQQEECASCHMPRIRPNNIAHAAITDHLIAIPRSTSVPRTHEIGTPDLSAWRLPSSGIAERDFGLALFQAGAATKNWTEVSRSYEILSHLPHRDADVLAALGSILLQQKHGDYAVSLYKQAIALEPQNARFHYVLGAALAQQSQLEPAIVSLRKSIELDPSSPDAYKKLAQLYEAAGQPARSKEVIREYLQFMPQNLSFRREE